MKALILSLPLLFFSNFTFFNSLEKERDNSDKITNSAEMSETQKIYQDHDLVLKNYASYNRWANERFVEWLQGASEEQLNKEIESSFTSLTKTLLHLWNAEYGWLQTLKGEGWGTPPGRDFEGSPQDMFEGFLATSRDFEEYVLLLSEEDFKDGRPLGRDGIPTSVEGIILHVFNHATYHRGQLITMGRQAGLTEPPRTDYIYYIRL